MKVAVVGCGVAGLAAALALGRRGHEVVILEAFDAPQPLGSGLLLQPSGLAALRVLGLADEMLARGARIERLEGFDLAGRAMMRMAYATWRGGAFGLGVHRAALFGVLFGAVERAGIEVCTGARVTSFDNLERPTLTDAAGRSHGPFDLVVVADGSASELRSRLRPRSRAPVYPWGAVWANAVVVDEGFAGALRQRYHLASMMAGVLPIGRAPGSDADLVSVFWSLPVADMDSFFTGDFAVWKSRVLGVWPEIEPLVAQFGGPRAFSRAIYRDVSVGRWSAGAFVLIGDAAHGTSPQLGQGANLGLIDAVELAARVASPADLPRYQRARRRQTGPYQLFSRTLTPLFQSAGPWGPFVRNTLFAPLSQAPGLDRIAAHVLTGTFRLDRTPPDLRP
ncbi:NAD(P)/FAD-dependent oxidoreductase [uncultured Phenylobacterium sp.]|uniref:FAD-dependent oxidoreductase n=1 Tax=uncultured Phenylobacterium sp. TaxID=349273 RepID=UPI0025F0A465|nr:NAD(P)/FAD-dependent oxidoreductase [uncultured Phenylobacterium sp.]